MYNFLGSPELMACTFVENTADNGGALCNNGASPRLSNCLLVGNSAYHGGALRNVGGTLENGGAAPVLINCTLARNDAEDVGGAIYTYDNEDAEPVVTNCILWENTPNAIFTDEAIPPTVSYSCVQGGYPGEGNLAGDPLFVDPDGGDWRPGTDSPCLEQWHVGRCAGHGHRRLRATAGGGASISAPTR